MTNDVRWKGGARAVTVWWPWRDEPTIYVPKKRQGDAALLERTMRHEGVHVGQWLEMGRVRFLTAYFTDALAALLLIAVSA